MLIAANGFFVAAEFALVAADRTNLERQDGEGNRRAGVVLGLLTRLSFHLSGAQLGITVTSLVLGFIAEPAIATLIEPIIPSRGASIALALVVATIAQMVLGELVPKSLAIARPMPMSLALGAPIRIYGFVFGPVIHVLNASANWTVRRLGIEPVEELTTVRSLPELALVFEASAAEGTLDERSRRLLARAIRFGEKTAADILVPRVDLIALPASASAQELVTMAGETGHSRFPVFGADLDDIRGVVHVKALHSLPPADRSVVRVEELMGEALAVPETVALEDLLFDLQATRNHLAVVVDEYGGTAGVVTLEDLVEEIVGEIADEHDADESMLTVVDRVGEWVLPGTAHPDEVEDLTGFVVPEGDYETLAGFLLDRLGFIPDAPGDLVEDEGWYLSVVEVDGLRIAQVRLVAPATDVAEADGSPRT